MRKSEQHGASTANLPEETYGKLIVPFAVELSFPVLLTLLLPLRRRAVVTTCLRTYHSASSSPSARRPSSGFDGVNEEAKYRRCRRACRCPYQ